MRLTHHKTSAASSAAALLAAASLHFAPNHNLDLLHPTLHLGPQAALARELASGSGSRVNKDPESLLRLALPAQSRETRELQAALEESADDLTRLLLDKASAAAGKAATVYNGKSAAVLKNAAAPDAAAKAYDELGGHISELRAALAANNVPAASKANADALTRLSAVEESVAAGAAQKAPPAEYTSSLPWLRGRATVAMTLKRDGGGFDVDGTLYKQLDVTLVVDGYTAPLTAGNFVDLVSRGFYNGMTIQRSDGFVVQTGDPSAEPSAADGTKNGFVPAGKQEVRKVPLEVFVKDDKAPIYGATFDDDGRGGYAAAMPFNAYGALGMAREEYDVDSASSQWFWLLFDSDLTPAGKNLLDGRYACFGYTTDGARLLSDVKEGDVIVSAKVVDGLDRLVRPSS